MVVMYLLYRKVQMLPIQLASLALPPSLPSPPLPATARHVSRHGTFPDS